MELSAKNEAALAIGLGFGICSITAAGMAYGRGLTTPLLVAAAWVVAMLIGFTWAYWKKWWPNSKPEGECATAEPPCYCENYEARGIIQPMNTWSAMAYVFTGFLILFLAADRSLRSDVMSAELLTICALAVTAIGPGTMCMHASFKDWGGWLDSLSIAAWTLFGIWFTVTRWFLPGLDLGVFIGVWLGAVAVVAVVERIFAGAREKTTAITSGLWLLLEIAYCVLPATHEHGVREWGWLAATVGTFAVAWAIWAVTQKREYCAPESVSQGHAIWHLLTAATTVFMFLYFSSEVPQLTT